MSTTVAEMAPDASQSAELKAVNQWLEAFESALGQADAEATAELFEPEGFWRDMVSFTWNITTMDGREDIKEMVTHCVADAKPGNWLVAEPPTEADGIIDAWITFETAVSRGRGHLRLRDGKAFTLLTTMVELKGYEEQQGVGRAMGVQHGADKQRQTWSEARLDEQTRLGYEEQPYCVIVGGGQGGIALGARMRMLGVPTIILEKNPRPGDSWRNRYKSLCLHDPVWYDHLPYIPFPEHWPVFAPKDKLGDWLEMYTRVMELNYWHSTECQSASYDEASKTWTVTVLREGVEVVLKPTQLVMATGMSGRANIPTLPGQEKFKGELQHSSQHSGPDQYAGKKVVVIGSNNSAHDICAALWENGADVTMVQRSSTHICKSNTLMDLALGDLYSEKARANGVDHHKADLIFASVPYKILPAFQIPVYAAMKERDKDLYDRLEKAGFMLDFGEDGSGLFVKYLRRGSGYYIDVGASELVADGKIKLKPGVAVADFTDSSVVFDDGSELEADLVVLATGYKSMNGWAAELISQEVADKVGKCWGLGSDTIKDPGPWEGELRNMWKPTHQENLWFHGGNLHQSRHYSQFLSLQIKARMENLNTPVYKLAEVHHLS
ncbi:MAG: putative flavoprotein involved in K+ transport [Granulosicoccus sp.]|jgi:putative flavoprotein involved in K+ transport